MKRSSQHILSTGQRLCYDAAGRPVDCAGSGQDGEFRAGRAWPEPRFETQGQDLVLDRLTGLIWPRVASVGDFPMSWAEALAAVAGMNREKAFGHADWRLPNLRELESLVDAEHHDPALPAGHPFENPQEAYWSSTSSAYAPDWAYCLYLHKGAVGVGFKAGPEFSAWFVAVESTPG